MTITTERARSLLRGNNNEIAEIHKQNFNFFLNPEPLG